MPWSPGSEPTDDALYREIAERAADLNAQRERWLNPPEWIEPLAAAAKDPRLKKRTLTHLYNQRPTWLRLAHERLDRAVLAAYAAVDPEGGWDPDQALVWTDTGAGTPLPPGWRKNAGRSMSRCWRIC